MKLCRFKRQDGRVGIGLSVTDMSLLDLSHSISSLSELFELDDMVAYLERILNQELPRCELSDVILLSPVERQEIWATGVTYLRSKSARMSESDFSAAAYNSVYEAGRPELFFKALPEKVIGPAGHVGIRRDAKWNVPEPELALILNSNGRIVGYTVGNDMSSRDLEGENLLYLPQAKIYNASCALGPFVVVGVDEEEARTWQIQMKIMRKGSTIFHGNTSPGQIKRTFAELAEYLCRSQTFNYGAVLLTGTGIVPPDNFTLDQGDNIKINITGIGTLENTVTVV